MSWNLESTLNAINFIIYCDTMRSCVEAIADIIT